MPLQAMWHKVVCDIIFDLAANIMFLRVYPERRLKFMLFNQGLRFDSRQVLAALILRRSRRATVGTMRDPRMAGFPIWRSQRSRMGASSRS
jgi:hypothetical protein